MNKNTNRNGHYCDEDFTVDAEDVLVDIYGSRHLPSSSLVENLPGDPFKVNGVDITAPF